MSLSRISLYYLGIYLAATIGMICAVVALELLLNYSPSNAVLVVIVPLFAAGQCGTIWFRRSGARPDTRTAWAAALIFAAITIGSGFAISAALYAFGMSPEIDMLMADSSGRRIFAGTVVVASLVILLVCRFGFGFSAWMEQRQQLRRAAKR